MLVDPIIRNRLRRRDGWANNTFWTGVLVLVSLSGFAQNGTNVVEQSPRPTPHDRHTRENRRLGGRKGGASFAFFEFAPSNAVGMTAPCACTSPTGAKGETLTFTRALNGTCTKTASGGLATTGIANGDLVTCSTNQPRVMYDANGVLGLLIESARTNVLLRNQELTNAAWADVGTPTVTDGATDPFNGTTGDTIDDNDGAAYEGRSQVVTVSAGAAYTMHCYVKAGTATTARLLLDGTAATITGLSSSTWSIIEVTDASSSGVSISAQVMVGNATTVTGTIIVGGCQVEAGAYRTSLIITAGSTVARAADTATVAPSLAALASTGSAAISVTPAGTSMTGGLLIMNTAGRPMYTTTTTVRAFDGANEPQLAHQFLAGTTKRYWSSWTGSVLQVNNATDATSQSGSFDGTMDTTGPLGIGYSAVIGPTADWIVTRICIDPDPLRCR